MLHCLRGWTPLATYYSNLLISCSIEGQKMVTLAYTVVIVRLFDRVGLHLEAGAMLITASTGCNRPIV